VRSFHGSVAVITTALSFTVFYPLRPSPQRHRIRRKSCACLAWTSQLFSVLPSGSRWFRPNWAWSFFGALVPLARICLFVKDMLLNPCAYFLVGVSFLVHARLGIDVFLASSLVRSNFILGPVVFQKSHFRKFFLLIWMSLAIWSSIFLNKFYLQIFIASPLIHSSGIPVTEDFLRMCRLEHIAILHSLARLIVRAELVCFIAASSMNHPASMRILFLCCRFLRCIFLGSTYLVFCFHVLSAFHLISCLLTVVLMLLLCGN